MAKPALNTSSRQRQPPPEMKFAPCDLKAVGADGIFAGYAALFDVPDLGNDVLQRGAFAKSLADRGPAGIKLLYQHDPACPIGIWLEIREDARGLYCRGKLMPDVARAREVLALMRAGALDGLSIGFRTVVGTRDPTSGLRRLAEVDLWEISVVTFPMQPGARIASVKAGAQASPHHSSKGPFHMTHTPAHDLSPAFDAFMRTFEAFKEENDARVSRLERGRPLDAISADKLERINRALDEQQAALDELVLKHSRPAFGAGSEGKAVTGPAALQHRAAFDGYVRKGETGALRSLEAKALSVGSDPDGGYLVPAEVERQINRSLKAISPIRAIAGNRQVSGSMFKKPFSITGPATGWVAETGARPETATPTLAELSFPTMELYAMPAATSSLLDDAAVDVEQWIAEEVRIAFAEQEGTAFVTGNGTNRPKGFMTYPKVANASWSWGNTGYLATGAAGAFPASNPSDKLIDLVYALKSPYRANAHFVMSRGTQGEVRKLKDAEGNYLWMPATKPGDASTLMGFPVAEAEDMPSIGTDAYAIAFGDFQRGYLVVDRVGIRVLRDPYSSKPYVLFYTTKRVGGGMADFDAIKLLRFGTA